MVSITPNNAAHMELLHPITDGKIIFRVIIYLRFMSPMFSRITDSFWLRVFKDKPWLDFRLRGQIIEICLERSGLVWWTGCTPGLKALTQWTFKVSIHNFEVGKETDEKEMLLLILEAHGTEWKQDRGNSVWALRSKQLNSTWGWCLLYWPYSQIPFFSFSYVWWWALEELLVEWKIKDYDSGYQETQETLRDWS